MNESAAAVQACECKSGGSIENEQAQRYEVMECENVARMVGLPFRPSECHLDVVYACLDAGAAGVEFDLDRIKSRAALLRIGDSEASLDPRGAVALESFRVSLPPGPPPAFVPLDDESAEAEYAELLLPELIAAASRGDEYVPLDSLVAAVMPYWTVYGANAKDQIRKKARVALALMIEKEFSGDFAFESIGSGLRSGPVIRVINSPARYDPRGRTQSWQRLRRKASAALGRPRAGVRPAPGQQTLFEDLGLGIDQDD